MLDNRNKIIFSLVILATLVPSAAFAANMNSENFSVNGGHFNSGGTIDSASSNFSLNASFGQAIVGDSTSGNFQIGAGFQKIISAAIPSPTPSPAPSPTPSLSGPSVGGGGSASFLPSHINAFNVPLTIEPVQSGTLTQNLSGGKKAILEIQNGSISSQTTIIIREEILLGSAEPLIEIGAILIGDAVFNITAQDAQGNPVRAFSQDITITLVIPELLAGKPDLGLYFLDDAANEWVLMPDAVFSADKVTFKVNHLTLFAIFRVAGLPLTIPIVPKVSALIAPILPLPPEAVLVEEEDEEKETTPAAAVAALPLFDILVEPIIELPGGGKITPIAGIIVSLLIIIAVYVVYGRIRKFMIKRKIDRLKK